MEQSFAEIIESNLGNYLAQAWDIEKPPIFGSLVEVETNNKKIYGIVTSVATKSIDSTHYPFIYKKTEEELKRDQPQIFEFLKTIFNVSIIGYSENNSKIYYQIPDSAVKIHTFVKKCEPEVERVVYSQTNFLYVLFSNNIDNIDELLLVILSNLNNKKLISQKYIENFCYDFSLLSGNDYKRLKLFLKRVQNIF